MLENNILLLNGITCIYNNSIENTEKFANYDINKSILNKIKNEQQKYVLHKNIKSIKSQLYVLRRKYGWKYKILDYIENGYCFIYSGLPKQIKRK